jgi:hypothetical protein
MNKPEAVGHLLDVTGPVEIERRGQGARKGALLFPLQAGDLLRLASGSAAELVLYANGARFALVGPAAAQVETTRLQSRSGTSPQARRPLSLEFVQRLNHPVSPPKARILAVHGLILRGTDNGLGPRRPEPSATVRGAPVTLRWAGPIHGEQLHLQITDGRQTVHAADLPPTARDYPVPAGVLQPGDDYVWFVTAVQDGQSRQSCGALLRVLSPAGRAELERLERELGIAAPGVPAAPPSPPPPTPSDRSTTEAGETVPSLLLLGAVYERLGMRAEARWAYVQVQRARPGDAGIAAALRRVASDEAAP